MLDRIDMIEVRVMNSQGELNSLTNETNFTKYYKYTNRNSFLIKEEKKKKRRTSLNAN